MQTKSFKKERYVWITIIFLVLIVYFSPFCSSRGNSSDDDKEQIYFDLLKEAMVYIRSNYVDETKISYKNLIHGSIKGMLESLKDNHTSFLSEKEYKELREGINGIFGGLGIYISIKDDYPIVIAPIEGTPAFHIGIQAGDKIVEIEGKTSKGMNIDEVVRLLKGKPGTKVSIKVAREEALELIPLTITRAIIRVPSVKHGFIKKGLAYIRIITFSDNTVRDLKKAHLELQKKGIEKLIIDLRNNPGGLLDSVVEVCDMFLNEGKSVYTRGRHSRDSEDFFTHTDKTIVSTKIPLVVLVNEGSASASEIFAGAIQDTHRGLVIGTKTFGKGSVQKIIPLRRSGEEIAMRITVQKYFTPSGRSIHGKGIEPDILVKVPKKDFEELYMTKKLNDGKYIAQLLKKHPKYSPRHVNKLMRNLKAKGIILNRRIVEKYLRNEKQRKRIQLFDLEYDIQLKKAIEVIESSKLLQRTVRVFK